MTDTGWRVLLLGAAVVSTAVPYIYWRLLWWRVFNRDNPPIDIVDQYYRWVGTVVLIAALPVMLLVMAVSSPPSA